MVPDGPPPSARELATFRLQLAEGVEEAYAAIYTHPERDQTVVYALRFPSADKAVDRPGDTHVVKHPGVVRVEIGSIVAVVSGDGGDCFQAVAEFLKSR